MNSGLRLCGLFLVCFGLARLSVAQSVTVSPTSLAFGNQVQGTASAVKKVTLTNGQSTAITITSVTSSLLDYTQTNNCPVSPSTLKVGKSCTISVTFTPSALGSRSATLTISDTGTSSPQTVGLSGTGVASVTVSPSSVSFGNEVVGVKSAASKVTLTNNQSVALTITKIATTLADYSTTTTCPVGIGTLAAGKTCTVSVFFDPTVAGVRNDTLTISDNANISPTVSLTGTGTVAATVNPSSLNFGNQALGTSSAAQGVTLTNNQSTSFKITSVSITPTDFTMVNGCPTTLAAGTSCTVSVTFSPKQLNTRTGTLTFNDKATNNPQIVTLTGTGTAANLVSIALTPANPSITAGATQQFTATGTYSDGSTQNLTSSVAWASSLSSVATINASGLATGAVPGSTSITATSGSISGSTTLTVTAPTLVLIAVTPANPSFALGTTQALKATGTYTDGSTQDLTTSVTWNTANHGVATVNSAGVASSVAVGSTGVTATSGSIVGSTNLTVTQATLVSIIVTPAIPSIPAGTTQQFTATGTFTDNSTQNVTTSVQWSSDTPSVATLSNAANSQGLATSVSAGAATITAASGSISGTTTLTVTAAALVSIVVAPANPSVVAGTTQQLTATGTFTDGSVQDLTATASWLSDTTSVTTVKKGLVTGIAAGSANVSAGSGLISGSTLVTVTAAQLVSIAINPQLASVPAGVPQQFTATGNFTDGSTQDLTQTGYWTSSLATVATISDAAGTQGLASTLTAGTTTIGVSSGAVNASATLTVAPATLVSIAISPMTPMISLGTSQQFTATGTYSDGTSQDLTGTVTWNSSNASVAVIGGTGSASSAGTGTTNISASLGSISNSTTLTVAAAALVSISVSPSNASIPLGTTQPFTATGTYSDGSTQDLTASAMWTSDTPQVATVGVGGLATGIGMGAANIIASSGNVQGSGVLSVGPPVLVSIAVTPGTATVVAGNSQQFTAIGTYTDGSMQNLTGSVGWSSSSLSIATVNAGLAKSAAQGSTNITAALGLISASASLTVTAPTLTSITVSPASASIADGTTQQFTAAGTFSDGSTQDLTSSASWTSSAPGIATIGSGGLATGAGIGNATITATSGSISGSASLAVGQPTLVSIVMTPANSSFALGTTLQMKATGTYTDGSTQVLTTTATWSTGDSSIATVDASGNVSSVAIGNTTVTASSGSVSGSTGITITPAALVSIAVTPAIPTISLGTTIQFVATGTFTDGSTQDVTQTVQWSSDATAVATIGNNAGKIGLATSVSTGTATITAASGTISGNTTLTVTAAALVSIAVTPASPTIALGTTQQFAATGTFTDGSTQDLTSTATWSSDDLSTATISNSGLATSVQIGTANISAASGNITGSTGLIVSAAQLTSIAINPPSAAIALGTTQQFTATGTYTDGTTQDVTSTVHWSSTNAGVATISNTPGTAGLASTLAAGATTIGASYASVSSSATLTVNAAALVSITISPQNATIPLGGSQQFTATGTYTDGSTQDVTSVATWSSSDATVLVVSNGVGTAGLATTSGLGTATVSATSGAISSSTTATVGQAALVSIAVTPANSSLAQGYTLQFAATGTYSDGSTQDLTQSAAWSSSVPGVASINSAALATAVLAGGTTISAASGPVSGSTGLTVTAAVPISISIGPVNPTIYINGTQQFTATLLYSNGNAIDVTASVAWTSFTSGVASISNVGLATGVGAGASVIQASWAGGALTATTTLNVSTFSVTVTPASSSIAIGGTQQFGASIAGTTNQAVTWAVDGIAGGNTSVGVITTGGFYTAPPMIGNHAITATSQANSGSVGTASITSGSLVPVANTFFGMHLHYASSAVPGMMDGTARIWDSNAAQWPNLNPTSGTFVWTNLDSVLQSLKSAGINDVLYTLWRVPKWASSNPTDTTCDYANLGPNFTGSCDLPTDLNADGTGTDLTWRNWVQNIAQYVNNPAYLQSHAKISYWETCNECYRSPTLDPGYGSGGGSIAYRGTYSQLVRMMQDARCIIVGVPSDPITAMGTQCGTSGYPVIGIDPSAKMVMPSTSPVKNGKNFYYQIMQNVLYCTCSNNSCSASTTGCTTQSFGSAAVDVLSVHIYPNNYTPEQVPSQVAAVRGSFSVSDISSKPFWSDEGGWGQNSNAPQINNGDPDLEAAWIARFYLMNWASGLTRSYWYEWDNAAYGTLWNPTSIAGCTTPFTSGFLCSGGLAYEQVYNWMVGSTLTNCSAVGTGWTCNLIQPNGSAAQILWDTSQGCSNGVCGTIQYNVSSTFNTYQDLTGALHSINGSVPVGIKPILLFTQ